MNTGLVRTGKRLTNHFFFPPFLALRALALPLFCLAFCLAVAADFLFFGLPILILSSTCHSTRTEYSGCGAYLLMEPQRINAIKASLYDMSMEELQDMSDDLSALISVLVTRQVAVEDTILDRLESAFAKQA